MSVIKLVLVIIFHSTGLLARRVSKLRSLCVYLLVYLCLATTIGAKSEHLEKLRNNHFATVPTLFYYYFIKNIVSWSFCVSSSQSI